MFSYIPFSFVTDFSGGVKLSRGKTKLAGVSLERLEDRKQLLSSFDQFRREADASRLRGWWWFQ